MFKLTRRDVMKMSVGAALINSHRSAVFAESVAAPAVAQTPARLSDDKLMKLGKLKHRSSLSITASPFSVGFETLDRKMFDPERTYTHLGNLGVKWARAHSGWSRTETTKGVYDFTWLDAVIDSLSRVGIETWFCHGYGNRLYTPAAPEYAVSYPPINDQAAREGWLQYTRRAAEHFGKRVKYWEIWNEPNANFWRPKGANPGEYVAFVKDTANEIRRRVPGAVIIGGALATFQNAFPYLEACMELGLGEVLDKFTFHPYRPIPEVNYASDLAALRAVLNRYKPGIEIWQGEGGCPSAPGGRGALSDLNWNEERQAKWLLRQMLLDRKHDVELTSYFHTVDLENYISSKGATKLTNFKGILRSDYTPKLSFYAYQNVCALFDAETKRFDLPLQFPEASNGNIHTATFMRGKFPVYAYWQPVDLLKDYNSSQIDLRAWHERTATLSNPVLIDSLTAQIYKLTVTKDSRGYTAFSSLPLTNHPLIITDAASLAIIANV